MAKFQKKKSTSSPAISTASLPDIIFMLLFFFMVTTTMRETTLFVKIVSPEATEVQKLEKKALVSYIYIGTPLQANVYGSEPRIQLNDAFSNISDISEFVAAERESKDEADRPFITTSLRIDKDTKMGIVTDVKQELRKSNALRINYSTRQVGNLKL
ncbi:MAG: biopolymer transporter ExbD [Bacteroidales bacterium]|nr:biopolymer transporter ExbD [Bacteroidales bacterium]